MTPLVAESLPTVQVLCRRLGVLRLDIFGSAADCTFDPGRSDIDFIVQFDDPAASDIFGRYFALKESLETLFGRPVDLVMEGAMRNRYFIDSANRSRRTVYAAALAPAA